jgi:hypothetical protein
MPDHPFLGLLSASKSQGPSVTHVIGSRDPLRRFHARAVFTDSPTGQLQWRGGLSCG